MSEEDWPWVARHAGWLLLGFAALAVAGIVVDQWWHAVNNFPIASCGNTIFYAQHAVSCAHWGLRETREGWITGVPTGAGIFGAILSGVGVLVRWLEKHFG